MVETTNPSGSVASNDASEKVTIHLLTLLIFVDGSKSHLANGKLRGTCKIPVVSAFEFWLLVTGYIDRVAMSNSLE